MTDHQPGAPVPPLTALPDGEAQLAVVLRLTWEDLAALGQEAGRIAARTHRPVTLDEAVSHRLRTRLTAAHAKPPQATAASALSAATPRTPGDQARQAIEKINGTSTPMPPASSGPDAP